MNKNIGILNEIKRGVPNRFGNMNPFHFEKFIGELFNDLGYQIEVTKSTGDFGADVLLVKDNIKTAVQVKRYGKENLVGVNEINQIIGGREYYRCDKAIIVTTSSFTKAAKKIADQTLVELWDWDKLLNEIKKVYMEGKNIYDFFDKENTLDNNEKEELYNNAQSEIFLFQIEQIRENVETVHFNSNKAAGINTIVHIKMVNTTEQKIYVTMHMPIIITNIGNQIEAVASFAGTFTQGYVYPNANVPLIFSWYVDQIPSGRLIKNVIVKYQSEDGITKEKFVSPDSSTQITKERKLKSGCFIATAVYGTPLAPEINTLRDFRDNILLSSKTGEKFVCFYYRFSPPIANFISKHRLLKICIREFFINPSVKVVRLLNKVTNFQ
ncbi:MAG: Restriction endonuclease [Parcubacteria group bacterium GW2011_GWB1_43_8]|nr:MAG: Restriction endonuclease [Parcubacteria group bacterium GW2011_GWB1_43_8]